MQNVWRRPYGDRCYIRNLRIVWGYIYTPKANEDNIVNNYNTNEEKSGSAAVNDVYTHQIQQSMKRAFLFLEDKDWNSAYAYFNAVLNLDAEYAPAYIGLLCVDLKLRSEELLTKRTEQFPKINILLRHCALQMPITAINWKNILR